MESKYIEDKKLNSILKYMNQKYAEVCKLMRITGWRIDDILNIKVNDIDILNNQITITERKTGKRSSKHLPRDQLLNLLNNSSHGLIFEGRKPFRPIARQTVWRHIKGVCKSLRLDPDGISSHSIRKNWAVKMYEETGSILEVQKALNHKYITTTMLYVFSDKLV